MEQFTSFIMDATPEDFMMIDQDHSIVNSSNVSTTNDTNCT